MRSWMHGWVAVAAIGCGPIGCGPQVEWEPPADGGGDTIDTTEPIDTETGTTPTPTTGDPPDASTGDTGAPPTQDPTGQDGDCQWAVHTIVAADAIADPFWGQVAAGSEGPLLARHGLQTYPLHAFDDSGAVRWSLEVDDLELVRDLWIRDDDRALIVGDVTGTAGVWLGELDPSGALQWSTVFDDGGGLWASSHVVPAPDGDIFVAYENEVATSVSRRDPTGSELWTASIPRPPEVTGQYHTIAPMPDGSVLQLRRADGSTLIHRSAEDGSVLAELPLDFWAEDIAVLPDGSIFVVGHERWDFAYLREVTMDGDTLAAYVSENQEFLRVVWDPQTDRLYVGGSSRLPGQYKSALREIFDRDLVQRFGATDPVAEGSSVLDVARLPAGGFVETRLAEPEVLAITCD